MMLNFFCKCIINTTDSRNLFLSWLFCLHDIVLRVAGRLFVASVLFWFVWYFERSCCGIPVTNHKFCFLCKPEVFQCKRIPQTAKKKTLKKISNKEIYILFRVCGGRAKCRKIYTGTFCFGSIDGHLCYCSKCCILINTKTFRGTKKILNCFRN